MPPPSDPRRSQHWRGVQISVIVSNVAMASRAAVATLAATPAAATAADAGTPDTQALPSAVSDNDEAAAATTQVLERSGGGNSAQEDADGVDKIAMAKENSP